MLQWGRDWVRVGRARGARERRVGDSASDGIREASLTLGWGGEAVESSPAAGCGAAPSWLAPGGWGWP
jgi:hypothetical protein